MIGISEIILILFVPVFVFIMAFWLWMLIDCLKRQDGKFAIGGNNAKLIWVLVIIFTGLIGALIYYFLIKRTDSHQDRLIGIALLASVVIVIILIASLFAVTIETTYSIEPYPSSKLPFQTPVNLPEEVIQPTSISQEQAKAIADLKINEVRAQTEFVEWEELWKNPNTVVGMPFLVRTVDEKPFYWTVPVVLEEKVIGFVEVKMTGKVQRYGGMGCLYSPYYNSHNLDNCSSTITISTAQEAKEIARNITDKYKDTVISEPIYVYDDKGCCGGEAWMLKVIGKDGKIISRVFVSGNYAYERKENTGDT